MSDVFRIYDPALADLFGKDGYSREWHATIKHLVREQAGHRCVRCGHPYRNGAHGDGHWSACDDLCTHRGPIRSRELQRPGQWIEFELTPIGITAAEARMDYGPERLEQRWEVEAAWRILTVHHLNNVKADCRWWNLAALCQRCHLTIQGKVVMSRSYDREHTEWFRPYVAGYYAFTHLGADLTRPEVEARLDELLALELRQERLPMSVAEHGGTR